MSVNRVLLDILIVLLAAKAASELSERARIPAVVGEIVAGVAIGPSALALVHGDDVLRVLGEIGVILLLVDVGMEMDIAELRAVGRASLSVASVGVITPFALGGAASLITGMSGKEALFVGAALTATSVGITARVFGDLRALNSVAGSCRPHTSSRTPMGCPAIVQSYRPSSAQGSCSIAPDL